MKILITGATGFLGNRLCKYFHNKHPEYHLIATGRNEKKFKIPDIRFIKADLALYNDVKSLTSDIDYVVHCAALSNVWGKYDDFYKSNVVATHNLCAAALQNKIKRMVHISTPSIYFDFTDKTDIREDITLPLKKANYYAETKYQAELIVDDFFKKGLSVITLRPRAIFGKGDQSLFPRIIEAAKNKFIPLMTSDDIIADITHVDNVIHAIILSLKCDEKYLGEKYNVTNSEPVKLLSLIQNMLSCLKIPYKTKKIPYILAYHYAGLLEFSHKFLRLKKEPPFTRYSIALLAKSQTLNIDKIKNDMGYNPIISIEKGINEVIESYLHDE